MVLGARGLESHQAFNGVLSISEQSVEATRNQVRFSGSLRVEVQRVGWSLPGAIESVSSLPHYSIL